VSTYILQFSLDGYDSVEERQKAEEEYIYDQLNCAASSVRVSRMSPQALLFENERLRNLVRRAGELDRHCVGKEVEALSLECRIEISKAYPWYKAIDA
jgi:hypothetical protein